MWLVYVCALLFFLWLEIIYPARPLTRVRRQRWFHNFSVFILTIPIGSFIPLLAGYGLAVMAEQYEWGLLNVIRLPWPIALALSLLVLDLIAYGLHRLSHGVPVLWAIHALHHGDIDVDATTALRHHPLEMLVSFVFTAPAILLFGLPPFALLVYFVAAIVIQIFHHSNLKLPGALSFLNLIVVTPELHHVHHSRDTYESNTNFAALLSVWDVLFGTSHRSIPREFGLTNFLEEKSQKLGYLLLFPVHVMDVADSVPQNVADEIIASRNSS